MLPSCGVERFPVWRYIPEDENIEYENKIAFWAFGFVLLY
jgi:hypothetical protein